MNAWPPFRLGPRPRRPQPQLSPLLEGLDTLDPSSGVALFTDGSAHCKDRSGGWAWVAIDVDDGEACGSGGVSDTTNNRMEMMAWIEGLVSLYEEHGACEILLYSDSEYVGYGATNRERNRKINRDLWTMVDDAIDLHTHVEWHYVKGHFRGAERLMAHEYNQKCDRLASKARKAHRDTPR